MSINFNDLPADIKFLIFNQNRAWTNEQIQNNKTKFNSCIQSINGFGLNIAFEEYRTSREILRVIREAKLYNINPFCMAWECCDGCDDDDCYYKDTYLI